MNYASLAAAAATVAFLAGCAANEAAAPPMARSAGECFHADRVNSFSSAGPYAANVRVGVNDYYRLELAGTCRDLDFTHRIAIRSRNSSWVCRGYDAELLVPDPMVGLQRCPVHSVRKLTEAEVKAMKD